MLEIGSVVDGKYKILNKIGQGGMSVVYLAMNEKANKQWAIKEVRKDGVQDFEVVKQGLVAETDMLKKLSHPNLPSIIDVIDGDGTFLIVMDYIEGNSLSHALEEHGPQPEEYVIEWAKQLCDVLGYLHTREPAIIYRDMKPSNVMLKPNGEVSLIDFGTAREFKNRNAEDTCCLGTRGYAAPEQFGGQGETDARTDIYCLGATMYHLLTGHNPATPPYEMKPIRYWNPALSGGLEEIILKCTRQDREERYQSCAELLFALENYESFDREYRKKQKLKMGVFVGSAVMCLAAASVSVFAGVNANRVKGETFDSYVTQANGEEGVSAINYYKKAIAVDNTKVEAYEGMLNKVLLDNEHYGIQFLDTDEKSDIEDVLAEGEAGKTNIEALKKADPKGAAVFFEDYAKILMFGNGEESSEMIERIADNTKADNYLKQVKQMMDDGDVDKASHESVEYYLTFLELTSLATKQGIISSMTSDKYEEYFHSIENMVSESNFDNTFIEAGFYWEMLDVINKNEVLSGFRKTGNITDREIEDLLDMIEDKVNEKKFVEEMEDTIFWKKNTSEMNDNMTLPEYIEAIREKIKSGTDNSTGEEGGE